MTIETTVEAYSSGGLAAITVSVTGLPVALFWCPHMADKLCKQLELARSMPHREAMHLLTQDLGMCETFAEHVYSRLFGEAPDTLN